MKGLLIFLQSVTVENRSTERQKETKTFGVSLGHICVKVIRFALSL